MKKYIFLIALLIFQSCVVYAVGITDPGLAESDEALIMQHGRKIK